MEKATFVIDWRSFDAVAPGEGRSGRSGATLDEVFPLVVSHASVHWSVEGIVAINWAAKDAHPGLSVDSDDHHIGVPDSNLEHLAIVSVSLGILNLLPVPLLDGGHLMYYVVEFIKGSPVSDGAQLVGQRVGIAILGALMCLAFYNDIVRLFVR